MCNTVTAMILAIVSSFCVVGTVSSDTGDISPKFGTGDIRLSEAEANWVAAHPVVTYSEVNWKPLSIIDGGRMVGVMGDYLDIIEKRTGITFKFITSESWPAVLDAFSNGQLDIVPGVGNSAREQQLGLISHPYAEFPLVLVGREDASFVDGPEDLEGKKLAIPKYYTSSNYIKENFPELEVIDTMSIEESLTMVSNGEADVFVGHKLVSIYNMEQLYLGNLKIIGLTEFNFLHSILVQNEAPELLSIINKVIARIDAKEHKRIYDDWVQVSIEQSVDFTIIYQAAGGAALLLIAVVYWNRRLKQAVLERTQELQDVLETLEVRVQDRTAELAEKEALLRSAMENMPGGMYILDHELKVMDLNQAFQDMTGEDIVPGDSMRDIIRNAFAFQFDDDAALDRFVEARLDYIREAPDSGVEVTLSNDHTVYVSYGKTQNDGRIGVTIDITDRKEAEKKLADAYDVISESINYASNIQRAILPDEDSFSTFFSDYMILWEPRDRVGGDVYWNRVWGDGVLVILADCTGHGVPGAFMTLIATGALDRALEETLPGQVGTLLQRVHQLVQLTLNQDTSYGRSSDDGLELGACYLNTEMDGLTFSGARFSLFRMRDSSMDEIKGAKKGLGYRNVPYTQTFEEVKLEVEDRDAFYLFSDGIIDQIGGPRRRAFGKKRLKSLLLSVADEPMQTQKETVSKVFADYQGEESRRDDVSGIGFRVG